MIEFGDQGELVGQLFHAAATIVRHGRIGEDARPHSVAQPFSGA
jgi:hypothetical protein